MMNLKLLYRVLDENWQEKEDTFVSGDGIKEHEGKTINLVIGLTGSGKTSMIQILAGGDQTVVRTKSETQDPVLIHDQVNNKLWLDTAGMCDSSGDLRWKAKLRDVILDAVKSRRFTIGRIFCVASDQNMDVNFAHEFIAFKNALPGSDWITRVVITKVNRRKTADQINAPGGLKHQYGSAFKCCKDHVLLHGYDEFNDEVIAHAASPSDKEEGVCPNDIGAVIENAELVEMIRDLKAQFQVSNDAMNEQHTDKKHTEQRLEELCALLDSSEETLDHLLSTDVCGKNHSDVRSTQENIRRLRAELCDNMRMLQAKEKSAAEVSKTCDRLYGEINNTKRDLKARMEGGLGLAALAGAKNIFLSFFRDLLS